MTMPTNGASMKRVVYICDWLPPDFGAVGQYSVGFARERAEAGAHVVLAGLTTSATTTTIEQAGKGRLEIVRLHRPSYDRGNFRARAQWTLQTNLLLLAKLMPALCAAHEVVITGSPPFMVHLLAPLRVLAPDKTLTYRITDFHPECLMAEREHHSLALRAFYQLTLFWRRRVDRFEALGEDQVRRLTEIGIPRSSILLKRDPCPVTFTGREEPFELPEQVADHVVLMYSGNWGVAHDASTFLDGYRIHHRRGSRRVALWLNATGAKADQVQEVLEGEGLPVYRGRPVPLEMLPRLLVTPDAHLITLSDAFVGFVLPSKVYGCAGSGKPVIFIGSDKSDVHLVCSQARRSSDYWRVDVDDPEGVAAALEKLAERATAVQTLARSGEGQ